MSLFNNEQFGENVKIWMGQIVDDEYWKDNEQSKKWSDPDEIPGWGARYKVRIFGNHPENVTDLKNVDLPWVEVMYPVTAGSGHAGSSQTSNLRKGAFVVGLYRDKEENEPFIIGCLGNNDQTNLNYAQTDKGFVTFSGFGGQNPENVPGYSQSQNGGQKAEANTTSATKEKTKADQQQKKDGEKSNALKRSAKCGGSELNGIQKSIQNLIQDIEEFKDNFQNNLITEEGKSYGLREYIQYKVTNVAKEIAKPIKWLINEIRKLVTEKVNNGLKDLYYLIFPEDRPKAKTALEKALELISCLFDKIIDNLLKMIGQFLMQIIDRFINAPLCAVENFLGQLLGEIVSLIMGALDAILGPLEAIFGAIDVALDVLNLLLDIIGFFSCNQDPECPEIREWSIWDGAGSNLSLDINSIFNKAKGVADQFKGSIDNIANFDFNIDFAGMLQGSLDSCNVGPLLCGPPTVSFYGGGNGGGTTGNVIVSAIGDILGVDIISPGSGYTKQPFVKIIDNCGKGSGAVGKPEMGIIPPDLTLTATQQSNGSYNINWSTKKADQVQTSFGPNTLNGTVNVRPNQTTTYTATAFGKKVKGSQRPYTTKSVTISIPSNSVIPGRPIVSGVPLRDVVQFVTSDIPDYQGNIGNSLGPGGNKPKPPVGDPCSDTAIIENILSTGKFTSDQIGVVNIIITDPGAGYLTTPDGSLGGDGRTWAQANETVIKRNDGTYDKPYRPGEVVALNKCDEVNPPDGPNYQVNEPIILTAPEPTGGPVRGIYATEDTGKYPVFLYLCGIEIEDGGANYDKDIDTITITPDNGAVLEPVFGPGGKLIDIKIIQNGFGFTERPVITVKTTTGYNAKINPILCVNRLDEDPIAASRIPADRIIKVVDCVGKI
jgi:hypothetical protein